MKSFAIWHTNKDSKMNTNEDNDNATTVSSEQCPNEDKEEEFNAGDQNENSNPEVELHFNLWKLKNKEKISDRGDSILDIAIKIKVPEEMSMINMFIPFHFDEIEDLGIKMKDNRKVINGIFNDDCDIKKSGPNNSTVIERIIGVDNKKNSIKDEIRIFTLDSDYQKNFDIEKTEEGTIITINVENDCSHGNESNYYRFRIKSDKFEKPIQSRDRKFATSSEINYIIDFRLNEKRSLPENLNMLLQKSCELSIKKIHFLLLMDISYKLGDTGLDYSMRSLEDDLWDDYLGNGYKTKDLVGYHWKQSKKDDEKSIYNFNSYIRIEEVKSSNMIIFMYFIGVLIFGLINNSIDHLIPKFINGYGNLIIYLIALVIWIILFNSYNKKNI